MEIALSGLYSEQAVAAGVTTDKADMIFASIPYGLLHTFQIPVYEEMARRDADFYAALEAAGFVLDFGEDGSGLFLKYLRRGSGYYIDVGAYPPNDFGLKASLSAPPQQSSRWRGPYLRKEGGLTDPWSRPYVYRSPGQKTPFEIISYGRELP